MESNLTSKELSRRDLQRSLTNRYEKIQKDRDAKNAEKLAAKDKIIAAKDKDLADRDLQHKLAYEEAFNSGYNRGFKNNSPSNWKFWTKLVSRRRFVFMGVMLSNDLSKAVLSNGKAVRAEIQNAPINAAK